MEYRRILALGKAGRVPIAGVVLTGVLLAGLTVSQAWVLSQIFATLYTAEFAKLPLLLAGFAVILLVKPLAVLFKELLVSEVGKRIKLDVRERLLKKLNQLGPFGLSTKRSGQAEVNVTDGVELLEEYFGRYIPQLFVSYLTVLVTLYFMWRLSPIIAIGAGIAAILTPIIPSLWNKALAKRGYQHWEQYSQLNAEVVDAMQGMTTLQLFNAVGTRRETLDKATKGLLAATISQMRISLLDSALSSWMVNLGPLIVLAMSILSVATGNLAPADMFWAMFLGFEIFRPFLELSANWHAGYFGLSTARTSLAFLATDSPRLPDLEAAEPSGQLTVAVENISFSYPASDIPALQEVSLQVAPGEILALVGQSGCGKSTLLGLLQRLADPQSGTISIGAVNLRAITDAKLQQLITLVPQEPVLFSGTIRQNLHLCAPDATDQEMLDICLALRLDDIAPAERLLDTEVGERGAAISGGQRQRVAIARALLRDTPILLLDEATSALDAQTEDCVLATMAEHLAKRRAAGNPVSVILAAHRMRTVEVADTVAVFDSGRLIQYGAQAVLATQAGRYQDLCTADRSVVDNG